MSDLLFEKYKDIHQDLIKKYKSVLPPELIEIWEEHGFCQLLDGFLRIINPDEYRELLKDTYFRGNISIPIFVTAFGDIVTFEKSEFIGLVKYKNGKFTILTKNFKRFIGNLKDEYFLEKYFDIPQYKEALNRFGRLDIDECYGYVPLLGLGGGEKVENINIVKTREHIEIISQLVGKIGM